MPDPESQVAAPESSSLARDALRSTLWTGFSQYWLFGLGLAKTVVLARLVPPEWFGVVALGQVWVSYLTILRFDFRTAVLAWDERADFLSIQFWLENLMALSGFGAAGLLYLAVPGLATPPVWAAIFVLLGMVAFESVTSTPRYLTEKRLRQDVIGRLTIFQSVVGFAIAIWLASLGYYLAALLLDALMPALVIGAGVALITRWRPHLHWDRSIARELLSFCFTLWTAGLLGKIVFQFDDWLVGTIRRTRPRVWLSSGILPEAYYSRAYVAGKMPMDVFAGMISLVALPLYTRSEKEGRDVLIGAYRRMTWLLAYMIFLSATFALAATEEVVLIVLGETWLPTVPLFRLMSLFVVLRPLYQNASQVLVAIRREKEMRRTVAIQAGFIVLVCPPAVLVWGAAGAAVVVSLMTLVGVVAAERYVSRELGVAVWPLYVPLAVAAITLLAVLAAGSSLIPEPTWTSAMIKGLLCLLGFGILVLTVDRRQANGVLEIVRSALRSRKTGG